MEDRERLIGSNLVRLREGRSQKDIADAMRARGWKWSQATVSSVEQGDRPLRLAEASDLALVLNKPLWRLLTDEPEAKVLRVLDDAVSARLALAKATYNFHAEQNSLKVAFDDVAPWELSEGTRGRVVAQLEKTVDDAIADGNERWRNVQEDARELRRRVEGGD